MLVLGGQGIDIYKNLNRKILIIYWSKQLLFLFQKNQILKPFNRKAKLCMVTYCLSQKSIFGFVKQKERIIRVVSLDS